MEELISRISKKISEAEILATKSDFDYQYGPIKLDEKTRNLCIFTVREGEITGYYRFLKGFYEQADIPTIFERKDKTLEYKHPAWLNDVIVEDLKGDLAKGDLKKHETEVRETMKKLENAENRLNTKKCDFFEKKIEWVGHEIHQHGIRPLQDKLEAITKIDTPKNEKEPKSFLGAIQYLSK